MKSPFTIRVEQVDRDLWHAAAKKAGMSISEWARRGLMGYAGSVEKSADATGDQKNLRKPAVVRVAKRRARAAGATGREFPGSNPGVREAERDAGSTAPEGLNPSASKFSDMDLEVARRTGHPPGCQCQMYCGQTRRHFAET